MAKHHYSVFQRSLLSLLGPSLTSHVNVHTSRIHFSTEDMAVSFKDWVRNADSAILQPIYEDVPALCGAKTSTGSSGEKLFLKYCAQWRCNPFVR